MLKFISTSETVSCNKSRVLYITPNMAYNAARHRGSKPGSGSTHARSDPTTVVARCRVTPGLAVFWQMVCICYRETQITITLTSIHTNIPPIRKEHQRATSIKQIHLNCSMRDRWKLIQHRKTSLLQFSTLTLVWIICAIINLLKTFPQVDKFIPEFVGSVSAQKLPQFNCPSDLQLPQILLDPAQLKCSHFEPVCHYHTAIDKVYNSFPRQVVVKLKNLSFVESNCRKMHRQTFPRFPMEAKHRGKKTHSTLFWKMVSTTCQEIQRQR